MKVTLYIGLLLLYLNLSSQEHPSLTITRAGIDSIKNYLGSVPKLDASLANIIAEVDKEIEKEFFVPIPKDLAGGYTHERHKTNFFIMQKSGLLFQITKDEKYARYIKDMLLVYAKLFPQLDRHPSTKSYARGIFFWQCLNDANWLVYTSQAYDCIYNWLDKKTRKYLNTTLFKPMADFLSIETPQFFNRIHNHSTWGNAAVGMIGIVMNDEELINRALFGLDIKDLDKMGFDNDGGSIQTVGQHKAGFIAQIDNAFSPDGYYTEGPYYQRYAMYPFLIFAQALSNNKPDLDIFNYRDSVLIKGVYALINQTNSSGEFFPINDAQKGMSFLSRELITAMSMAYYYGEKDPQLLGMIAKQNRVPLNITGLTAALALTENKIEKLHRKSVELSDGPNGNEGALGILRKTVGDDEVNLVMKYTKHGMGHGHFDKLSFSYYHNENEVFQDYGAARWVNIEQKDGGGYLKENKTWAKQTIAHNTLTINSTSQYKAKTSEADLHHSQPKIFVGEGQVQVMCASEDTAYKGIKMTRTFALVEDENLEFPLVIDVYNVLSNESNTYDMPWYFVGHTMQTNFDYEKEAALKPMGEGFGYQHLWKEASGIPKQQVAQLSWFNKNKFYTLTTSTLPNDQLIFGRIGANDPKFNLRNDPVFILKREDTKNTCFASTYEIHGSYSTVSELATNTYSKIQSVEVLQSDSQYVAVAVDFKKGNSWLFVLSNNQTENIAKHSIILRDKKYKWEGLYKLFKI